MKNDSEADNLLTKIILMHPFMEEAMDIQIEISWFNNGILYSIKCSIEYIPTPIQWR